MGRVYSISVETSNRYFGTASSSVTPSYGRRHGAVMRTVLWVADLYLRVIATFERARELAEYVLLVSFTGYRVGDTISYLIRDELGGIFVHETRYLEQTK